MTMQLRPYRSQREQTLEPRNFISRMVFHRWLLKQHRNDRNFLYPILWTDESKFTRNHIFYRTARTVRRI